MLKASLEHAPLGGRALRENGHGSVSSSHKHSSHVATSWAAGGMCISSYPLEAAADRCDQDIGQPSLSLVLSEALRGNVVFEGEVQLLQPRRRLSPWQWRPRWKPATAALDAQFLALHGPGGRVEKCISLGSIQDVHTVQQRRTPAQGSRSLPPDLRRSASAGQAERGLRAVASPQRCSDSELAPSSSRTEAERTPPRRLSRTGMHGAAESPDMSLQSSPTTTTSALWSPRAASPLQSAMHDSDEDVPENNSVLGRCSVGKPLLPNGTIRIIFKKGPKRKELLIFSDEAALWCQVLASARTASQKTTPATTMLGATNAAALLNGHAKNGRAPLEKSLEFGEIPPMPGEFQTLADATAAAEKRWRLAVQLVVARWQASPAGQKAQYLHGPARGVLVALQSGGDTSRRRRRGGDMGLHLVASLLEMWGHAAARRNARGALQKWRKRTQALAVKEAAAGRLAASLQRLGGQARDALVVWRSHALDAPKTPLPPLLPEGEAEALAQALVDTWEPLLAPRALLLRRALQPLARARVREPLCALSAAGGAAVLADCHHADASPEKCAVLSGDDAVVAGGCRVLAALLDRLIRRQLGSAWRLFIWSCLQVRVASALDALQQAPSGPPTAAVDRFEDSSRCQAAQRLTSSLARAQTRRMAIAVSYWAQPCSNVR
eukprot:TRINITY_DN81081_c0_g1_i1.p1 TRINITY_DN81081_c0_g1~~TRINITY_DN81081_c0_g1_i1.p1  ORF type:complete len:666 (+),score=146.66 TRINITY_DN81081_c0_g1_i1:134-2131(+)